LGRYFVHFQKKNFQVFLFKLSYPTDYMLTFYLFLFKTEFNNGSLIIFFSAWSEFVIWLTATWAQVKKGSLLPELKWRKAYCYLSSSDETSWAVSKIIVEGCKPNLAVYARLAVFVGWKIHQSNLMRILRLSFNAVLF